MKVEQVDSVAEFLGESEAFRAGEPALTNVLGSIATSVRAGREYEAYYWWLLRDDAGAVVGTAIRTAPHQLLASPMPLEAARALGAAVAVEDPHLPGVAGPPDVVDAVVDGLGSVRPTASRLRMRDLVHVLDGYVPPAPVAGSAVPAAEADVDELVVWHLDFAREAGVPMHDAQGAVLSRLPTLWWWEVDGSHVAMAGHAPTVVTPTGRVSRIGPVYTHPDHRRRGYGAAVTAALVELLLPASDVVMLYADAENATSNGVYERLGFRPVAEVVEVELIEVGPG